MKSKLFYLLFLISSLSFGQNWTQVGSAKFTNFAKDAAMAFHPTTGNPYVIYANVLDANKPYVVKFDGTNWVAVGTGAIIANEAVLINIAFNPSTNEPNVAFKNKTTNRIDIYKFDGTNWVAIKTSLNGSDAIREIAPLSIQYDTNNNIYVFGHQNVSNNTANHLLRRFYDVGVVNGGGTSSWSYDQVYSIKAMATYPTAYNKYVVNNTINHTAVVQRADVYQHIFNTGNNDYHKNIDPARLIKMTSVSGGNYWAGQNEAVGNAGAKRIIFGYKDQTTPQPLNTTNNTSDILSLAEDKTQNRAYLMYSDSSDKLQFQKYSSSFWSTLPDLNITTNTADFFSGIKFNSTDNHLYLFFLDGGKVSIKKYQPTPSIAKYYVNANVSGGNNSGDSWANAKSDLKDVFNEIGNNTSEIWIAKGTYKPGTGRSDAFNLSVNNLKIYGGFAGTETTISERKINDNPTILSGDLNGDDTGVDFSAMGRTENSYHIVKLNANDIIIDGIQINDGHANGTSTNAYGSAILVADTANSLTLKNCSFKNNVGLTGGAIRAYFDINASINIQNSVFNNNLSRYGSVGYFLTNKNRTVTYNITNCLFTNNTSKDKSGTEKGYTASALWIRANASGSNVTSNITNCTFANNTDIGTQASTERGVLSLAKNTGGSSTHNANISNSIFYNNKGASNVVTKAINKGHVSLPNTTLVNNSIDEDNFSNLAFLTNTSNSDPLLASDFKLQATSPAVDTGDNSKIPSGVTLDLAGNSRIYNTTVDMGAFEYDPAQNNRTLTITATNGNITTNPNPTNGIYTDGTSVTLTATPDTGYQFNGWSGDATGTTNPLTITMDADKNITAMFIKTQRTLTIVETNGTITVNPTPTTITGNSGTFDDGTVVTLTPVPDSGYEFSHWTGDFAGTGNTNTTNPLTITMDADKNVTAVFAKIQHSLTLTATNGSVATNPNPTNGTYDYGTAITLTPTPNAGYQFDGWSGDASGTTDPLTITMDADKNITAMFSRIQYILTLTSSNGTIVTNPNPTNGKYDEGTSVTLTATPDTGYEFKNWAGHASGTTNQFTIVMNGHKIVTATFVKIQRTLTITATNGTVSINPILKGKSTYDDGESLTLTATPNTGYQFVNWSGDASGTTNPLSITMDADKNITAIFSSTASIDEEKGIEYFIYPNPAKNTLNIRSNSKVEKVSIYNLLGKKVIETTKLKINLERINSGIYLLKMKTEKGIITKKIIKE
ncbi:putative repeat protein (TIGR02543 family)/predicted secreted protein (Por secretion system target) [Lutibacter sp. Hel_I_33_5]|uniref:InlB B-repeat-containing protein n=1 Tax=Lutibacter sp. Hel_I_33_5 TaxID=1566289 RepID=UPI0011A6564E|nr:T9SS type A sorting domain-containing protein [Lutibacter sp. Hel_I_33_5]TVZ56903.1 putative repeat protein (TIGR02543 family)/predicted secreted protein (Por secretion system target) [Lutibacter sp. Hel_I_33_5]